MFIYFLQPEFNTVHKQDTLTLAGQSLGVLARVMPEQRLYEILDAIRGFGGNVPDSFYQGIEAKYLRIEAEDRGLSLFIQDSGDTELCG